MKTTDKYKNTIFWKRTAVCLVKFLISFIVAVIMIYPLWYMVTGSFKDPIEFVKTPPSFFPEKPILDNFKEVLGKTNLIGTFYMNSFTVALTIPILQTVVCLPAAYAFARLRFPCKNFIFMLFMGAMMLPGQMTMITNYVTMIKLNLQNKLLSLILLGVFSTLAIFMMRQYFMNLPRELEEAAKIDGCSEFGAFLRIAAPLAKSIVAVNVILCFNGVWGDFFGPMILLRSTEKMTLPLGMTIIQGAYATTSRAVVTAALTLSIIPSTIIYFLFRKQLISGIASSGLKM